MFVCLHSDSIPNTFMFVDGKEVPIREPNPLHPKWCYHKLNRPELRYEVGVSSGSGEIMSFKE